LNVRGKSLDWNSETIWGSGGGSSIGARQEAGEDDWPRHVVPRGLGTRRNSEGNPVAGIAPSLTTVKIFYSNNGLPLEIDNNRGYAWTSEGRMAMPAAPTANHFRAVPAVETTANLHHNREARFYAAIGYHHGVYEFNDWTEHVLNMRRAINGEDFHAQGLRVQGEGNADQINNAINGQDRLETGYAVKKGIRPDGVAMAGTWTRPREMFPIMRLADLYLMYAEACAEANGRLDDRAKGYIAAIHNRAGLDGANFYYRDFTGAQLVEAVRRERMIELIFESAWHFDLHRWQMADKWYNEGMWASQGFSNRDGMWGLNILGMTNEDLFREVNRNGAFSSVYRFDKRMYLLPIRTEYININPLLVQNPGY
jgi:hypothetical protein